MINSIISDNLDINDDERYPQFMQTSPETNDILIAQLPEEPASKPTLVQELIRMLKRVIELLVGKLMELFAAA